MTDLIRLSLTTVNAPDAIALARFYAEITGGVAKGDESWALVEGPNGDIGFQQIDDYRPPTWPDGEVGMQMHLEFLVDDLEATGARVLAAGATRFEHQPNADHCFVYADPAGHPFCLSTWGTPRVGD
ncbi:VOC family protein [Micromonospora sp. NPDC053740]|uniref:VOC family protein n=1 Tax=Micromonospora TaxID=1873 RepID=UPI001EE784A0|nr:VOC family protein [Micromonospora alfalfae]MCG5462131.1 VOC family protein [Micromonospora alfalfae]